jgi:signal peptidase I
MGKNLRKSLLISWLALRGFQATPRMSHIIGLWEEFIVWLFIFSIAAVMLTTFVVIPSGILQSSSMAPTIQPGDNVLIEKISWKVGLRPLQPGDIIAFNQPRKLYKRLIAVGGQRVMIENCYVYVNGHPLKSDKFNHPEHPDPQRRCYYAMGWMQPGVEVIVPQGHYFVLGDNSMSSFDSRFEQVGFVKQENVYGRIILRIWPPSRFGVP